jgi:hypothetical protein
MKLRGCIVSVCALVLAACGGTPEDYELVDQTEQSLVDNQQVLGFESSTLWTASTGTKSSTTDRTQGALALALKNFTYAELQSVALTNLSGATPTLSFDLKPPVSPAWGQAQLFVSIPSRGVNNAYIGQVWIAGIQANVYRKLSFAVPSNVVSALSQTYSDLRFKIALSVPQTSVDYKVDNLRFEGGETLDQACSPPVSYVGTDPEGSQIVTQAIQPQTPAAFMVGLTRQVCAILYRNASEVTRRPNPLTLRVYDFDGIAFADDTNGDGVNDRISMSSRYIEGLPPSEVLAALRGVLSHEAAHIYQHGGGGVPGGVIEGVADYVRYTAGYDSLSRRFPGGNWDDGYTTTGFFLSWLDGRYPNFVYRFNLRIGEPWSTQFFIDLTGTDVNTLWSQYQDEITP